MLGCDADRGDWEGHHRPYGTSYAVSPAVLLLPSTTVYVVAGFEPASVPSGVLA